MTAAAAELLAGLNIPDHMGNFIVSDLTTGDVLNLSSGSIVKH